MIKMYKKAVAIMLTLVFVLSLVPVVGMAETVSEEIRFIDCLFTRNGTKTTTNGVVTDYKKQNYASDMSQYARMNMSGSSYYGYAKLNLDGYEEVLINEGTTVDLSFARGSSSKPLYAFTVYIGGDKCDSYKLNELTYNQAVELGFHPSDFTLPVLYEETSDASKTISKGQANLENIITALDEGTENSCISMVFKSTTSDVVSYISTKSTSSTYATINYDESLVDNQAYVDELAKELTWDKISAESDGNVTSASKLPLKYKGAVVSWESSNPDVINPDTGVITQLKGEDAEVELEATLKYTSFEKIEKTAAEKVKMNVTVAAEEPVTLSIPFSAHTYIRSGTYADRTLGVYSVNGSYSRFIENTGINKSGDKAVFLKYDFSNYLNILDVANAISININVDEKNTTPNGNLLFSVLPDSCESWAIDNLTYNTAVSSGLYTTPAVYTEIVAPVKDGEISSSAQMLDAIKDSIGDNPDDGVVCFKWSGIPGNGNTSYRVEDNKAKDFTITLSYYASDLKTNEELAESKFASMPWSFVPQKGKNFKWTDLSGKGDGKTVKIMLLENMTTLKPLAK